MALLLASIEEWGAEHAAAGVVAPGGVVSRYGNEEYVFRWASVTKLVTATAVLVGAEEGILDLDEPAGPPGSTVRHLLAHASGLPFEGDQPIARAGRRRIYSNAGYDELGRLVADRAGMPFADYLAAAVFRPLAMASSRLDGSPGSQGHGPISDLLRFAQELLAPSLVAPETFAEATSVQFPGLAGVLPGVGRYDPNDWGLGFELRNGKSPHWTGSRNSPRTFGHFGGAGTFVWVDPDAGAACVCLTDREFGDWALAAWPKLSDEVLDEAGG
ncbi:MAG: beta-lactamase family protein [Actinomycetota bacterium]|nr:beta-lactamase family protein [Actinomycetota bacterium]